MQFLWCCYVSKIIYQKIGSSQNVSSHHRTIPKFSSYFMYTHKKKKNKKKRLTNCILWDCKKMYISSEGNKIGCLSSRIFNLGMFIHGHKCVWIILFHTALMLTCFYKKIVNTYQCGNWTLLLNLFLFTFQICCFVTSVHLYWRPPFLINWVKSGKRNIENGVKQPSFYILHQIIMFCIKYMPWGASK